LTEEGITYALTQCTTSFTLLVPIEARDAKATYQRLLPFTSGTLLYCDRYAASHSIAKDKDYLLSYCQAHIHRSIIKIVHTFHYHRALNFYISCNSFARKRKKQIAEEMPYPSG
jgi:hypothetical protein